MSEPSETTFPGGNSVKQAYDRLTPVEPTTEMDQAVLKYAKASTRPSRKNWGWPVSMAAGLLVTLGIVTQMAQIVPSGSYPRSPVVETIRPEPRAAVASGEFNQSRDLQAQTIVVEVPGRSADAWIEHLQSLAEQERTQEFFRSLAEARHAYPGLTLPEGLRQWAERELPESDQGD